MKKINDRQLLSDLLIRHNLLTVFNKEHLEHFNLYMLEKGEVVFSVGDHLEELLLLVRGRVKISTPLPNGKSLLLRFNNSPSMVGELEFVTKRQARNSVECLSECLLIGIKFNLLYEHYYNHPAFLQYIVQHLGNRLYSSSNAASLNLLTKVENRFASYLLSMLTSTDDSFEEEIKTSNLVETAELLGTSYRHLNRVINGLVEKDIVERRKGIIQVKNMKKLEELADGIKYE
ncbi:Crp/Fnr family transcriptional regulator [Robertmurraya andreesenii]|uniref:CRP-like cAMP-binding protein n=1 Tax=Anoxybacillus andreesenii TaxID=1325932 RepID=A0ABT9V3M4_9BACL|nr:cyclic nucleotide-binding domain-containing protein [Robertmurraya andreesenii]MDQ0155460.1 CRP-like cAMP-binding protein [Robertmurraya andreesenii]